MAVNDYINFLTEWEKKNNPDYPNEMLWERQDLRHLLEDFETKVKNVSSNSSVLSSSPTDTQAEENSWHDVLVTIGGFKSVMPHKEDLLPYLMEKYTAPIEKVK